MFDFNEQFNFSEADRDMTDALFGIFFMNQQSRTRTVLFVQTKPNQRSEQGQKTYKSVKRTSRRHRI